MSNRNNRRLDKNRIVLRKGEIQRTDGIYCYRWTERNGKRRYVYAGTLEELREKEAQITVDEFEGIRTDKPNMFFLWCDLKRGIKHNTLKELKQSHNFETEKRKVLTIPKQRLFVEFLKTNMQYNHWYPIFAVMLGTGMRVVEITGLRWNDIDFADNMISINHTLVYYNHGDGNGCSYSVNTPKTKAGERTIPMLDYVRDALRREMAYQAEIGISCRAEIDGYTDFVFVNRFGGVQNQGTLNKALRRIIRDCNDEILLKGTDNPTLLPHFSCHSLRHTFATRLCENGVTNYTIYCTVLNNVYKDLYRDV